MTTYYVAKNGVNTPGGGSSGSPFLTIQYGINAMSSGDTLEVRDGVYVELVDITKPGLTIQAASGHSVTVDGQAGGAAGVGFANVGLPNVSPAGTNPDNGVYYGYAGLVDIQASNTVWDGIDVMRSRGQCIRIFPAGNATISNITVKNCKLHDAYFVVINMTKEQGQVNNVVFQDVEIYNNGMVMQRPRSPSVLDWGAAFVSAGASYVTMTRVSIHDSFGEGALIDSNDKGSHHFTITECSFYNCMSACMGLHAPHDVTIDRCFFGMLEAYTVSPSFRACPCQIKSVENPNYQDLEAYNITITNSLMYHYRGSAFGIEGGPCLQYVNNVCVRPKPWVHDIQVYNNTIISVTESPVWAHVYRKYNIRFRNNLMYGGPGKPMVKTAGVADWIASNNGWSSTPNALGGPGDVIGGLDLVDWDYSINPASVDLQPFTLQGTSDAIGAGYNGLTNHDYFNNARGGVSDDIGFEEYGSSPPPVGESITAGFTVDVSSGEAPLTVTVTDDSSVAGGGQIDAYLVDFGNGETANGSGPWEVTYDTPDVYTIELEIRQLDPLIISTYSLDITVGQPETGGGVGDGEVADGQAAVTASTTSTVIPHGMSSTPKAVELSLVYATADETPVADIYVSLGKSDGTNEGCVHILTEDGEADGDRQVYNDCALIFANLEADTFVRGTVSFDGTNITIDWDGNTPSAGTIQWVAYAGTGVSVKVGVVQANTVGSQTPVNTGFKPDLIKFLNINHFVNQGKAYGALSYGAATQSAQAMVDHGIYTPTAYIEHRSEINDEKVFKYCQWTNYYASVASFDTSGFTLNIAGADVNTYYVYLAIKLDGLRVHLSLQETGVTAEEVDYALGFEPQYAEIVASPITEDPALYNYNPVSGVGTAGFGLAVFNGSVSSSFWAYDTPGGSVSDANTIKDSNSWHVDNYAGTTIIEAVGSFPAGENKLRLNYYTAPATSCWFMLIAIEEASNAVKADFTVNITDGTIQDSYQFSSLSSGADIFFWTFQDAAAGYFVQRSEENPLMTFGQQLTLDVTLQVIDSVSQDSAIAFKENYITVSGPTITGDFVVTPEQGNYPLRIQGDHAINVSDGVFLVSVVWEYALQEDFSKQATGNQSAGFNTEAESYGTFSSVTEPLRALLSHSGSWVFLLTVEASDGQTLQILKENYVDVDRNEPIAAFTYELEEIDAPIWVKITDVSDLRDEEIESRNWEVYHIDDEEPAPQAFDSLTHAEGDFVVIFNVDNFSAGGVVRIQFRKVDANNYWYLRLGADDDGLTSNAQLYEVVDGTGTKVIEEADVVSEGDQIKLIVSGATITIYVDFEEVWSYTQFASHYDGTTLYVDNLGSCVISDLMVGRVEGIYEGPEVIDQQFEEPGDKRVFLIVETTQGKDVITHDITVNQRNSLVIGPPDPRSITQTSQNRISRRGHTHFIPSSTKGGVNKFVATDELGRSQIDYLGVGGTVWRTVLDFLNRRWATPLSITGFLNSRSAWGGMIAPEGSLQISAQNEIKLGSDAGEIIPRRDRGNTLGTPDFRWRSAVISQIITNMMLPQNMLAGLAGNILVAPSATLYLDLPGDQRTSAIFVDKYQYINDNDVLLVTDGEYYEFMIAQYEHSGNETIDSIIVNPDPNEGEPFPGTSELTHSYRVSRDYTGLGARAWKRGDTVFNLGQDGDGFFEWYATHPLSDRLGNSPDGINGKNKGPVLAYHKKTGNGIFYSPIFAVGNLQGFAGILTKTPGVMIGSEDGARIEVRDGNLYFFDLPTSDPHEVGALWNNSGVPTISSG